VGLFLWLCLSIIETNDCQLYCSAQNGAAPLILNYVAGWPKDRFYNDNHPFFCNCGARYLFAEGSVSQAFDSAETVAGNAGFNQQAKAQERIDGSERSKFG